MSLARQWLGWVRVKIGEVWAYLNLYTRQRNCHGRHTQRVEKSKCLEYLWGTNRYDINAKKKASSNVPERSRRVAFFLCLFGIKRVWREYRFPFHKLPNTISATNSKTISFKYFLFSIDEKKKQKNLVLLIPFTS